MRDPERSIGFLVSDVGRLLRRRFNRRAEGLGLSQAQWSALASLAREQGVNQSTLAARLEIQPITLARLIDQLQASGLVERRQDPEDRRAFRLYLTPAARPLIGRMWELASDTRDEALAGLGTRQQQMLISCLQHMKRNLVAVSLNGDGTGAAKPKPKQKSKQKGGARAVRGV